MLLLQSPGRLDLLTSVMDSLKLGSSLSLHSLGRSEFKVSAFGKTQLGLMLPVLDLSHLALSPLIQSFSQADLVMLVLDLISLGLSLPIRSLAHPELGPVRLRLFTHRLQSFAQEFCLIRQSDFHRGSDAHRFFLVFAQPVAFGIDAVDAGTLHTWIIIAVAPHS